MSMPQTWYQTVAAAARDVPLGTWFLSAVRHVKGFLDAKSSIRLSVEDISLLALLILLGTALHIASYVWNSRQARPRRLLDGKSNTTSTDVLEIKQQIIREADAVRDIVKEAFEERKLVSSSSAPGTPAAVAKPPAVTPGANKVVKTPATGSRPRTSRKSLASEDSESSASTTTSRPQRARKATVKFSPSRRMCPISR
jgi:hypothetical protein